MGVRTLKPTSAARRYLTVRDLRRDHEGPPGEEPARPQAAHRRPELAAGASPCGTSGGGPKRKLRQVDFRREKLGIPARVAAIEYDPNRGARIALLYYRDGEKRYIIAPHGLKVGDTVMSGPQADILPGNALPIRDIPVGTTIHNIELQPGKGGQLCRSAGTGAQLVAKEGEMAHVKLPSGETRLIRQTCMATIGQVGNLDHENVTVGKAGRSRWLGIRPTVRGTAMNPVDHPMGGGEGRGKGNHPMTPWGKPTKGAKTRRRQPSDRYIVARRGRRR